jgi:DNA-binding response OmpR family regulator
MRVLLAEDDKRLGNLIKHMLIKQNIEIDWVQQGDIAFEYAMLKPYDLVILDWMMPGETGISVCDRLRKQGYHSSILILTARDDVADRVLGLDTGADDYLVKPFETAELLARIRALARRGGLQLQEEIVEVKDLVVNRSARTVKRGDREIQLTGREFKLLDLLIQNRGHVLPRDVILDRVWGLETEVSPNNLDAYIRLLRKKVEVPGEDTLIHNVRGLGYRLEV